MRRSKLDIPHIKKDVIRRLAVGESQGSIAKGVGLSQSQISRFARREDIKPLIENEQMRLIEKVPDAVDYVKSLIPRKGQRGSMDMKEKELAYKASHDVLKAVGIMPSACAVPSYCKYLQRETPYKSYYTEATRRARQKV